MPFKIHGLSEMRARIGRARTKFPMIVAAALREEATIELEEAKRRTPVWNPARPVPPGHTPGSLRDSGRVIGPTYDRGRVTASLAFGNDEVDYAVYVHEDLDAFHATGQAKFLESTLHESAGHMASRIAARIDLKKAVE